MEFLILRAMSTMLPRPILNRAKLKGRQIADFQVGKCTFAPVYLKSSDKECETFSAFLFSGRMPTMLSRSIFDIRANYVARFVKISSYRGFSRWKMYLCTNLYQNLYEGGWNIFGIFNPWNNVYNGIQADL